VETYEQFPDSANNRKSKGIWSNFKKNWSILNWRQIFYCVTLLLLVAFIVASSIFVIWYEIRNGIDVTRQELWYDIIMLGIGILCLVSILTALGSDLVKEYFDDLITRKGILSMIKIFSIKRKKRMFIWILTLYGTLILHMVHIYSIDVNITDYVKMIQMFSFWAEYMFLIFFIVPLVKIYIAECNKFSLIFKNINKGITTLKTETNEIILERLREFEKKYYENWKNIERFDKNIKYFIAGVFIIFFSEIIVAIKGIRNRIGDELMLFIPEFVLEFCYFMVQKFMKCPLKPL
jgi:hypothetical protein